MTTNYLVHAAKNQKDEDGFYYECLICKATGKLHAWAEVAAKEADKHVSERHPDIDEPDDDQVERS